MSRQETCSIELVFYGLAGIFDGFTALSYQFIAGIFYYAADLFVFKGVAENGFVASDINACCQPQNTANEQPQNQIFNGFHNACLTSAFGFCDR